MIIIGFILCLSIAVFSFYKEKDLVSPVFILSSLWAVMYMMQIVFRGNYGDSKFIYLIFALGVLFFSFGYYLTFKFNFKKVKYIEYLKSSKLLNIIFLLIVLIFIIHLITLYKIIISNFNFNIFQTITQSKRNGIYVEPFFIEYGRNFALAFCIFYLVCFFKKIKGFNFKQLFSLIVINFVMGFSAGNRGSIFFLLISILFGYIFTRGISNKRILILLSLLFALIIFYFIVSSFQKFVYQDQSNSKSFISSLASIYFSTSMPAFVFWYENGIDFSYGANTFSFVLNVLNALGFNFHVNPLIQDFIYIDYDYTNVYTVYQYYAKDFGVIYSIIMQFLFGLTYSVLYLKVKNKRTILSISILALLYFPLINQFFDDKYFSITSTWIQLFTWLILFNYILIKKNIKDTIN